MCVAHSPRFFTSACNGLISWFRNGSSMSYAWTITWSTGSISSAVKRSTQSSFFWKAASVSKFQPIITPLLFMKSAAHSDTATVYCQHRTRCVARYVRGEVASCAYNFFGVANAFQRQRLHLLFGHVHISCLRNICRESTTHDGVDTDARTELRSERFRHEIDPRFGDPIREVTRGRPLRRNRRDVDDRSTGLPHHSGSLNRKTKRAFQIYSHDLVEQLFGERL